MVIYARLGEKCLTVRVTLHCWFDNLLLFSSYKEDDAVQEDLPTYENHLF